MGTETDIKQLLVRVLQTISMGVLWALVNTTLGIYFSFAFYDTKPTIGNYIYYLFFLVSLGFLLAYYKKKWKGHI